MGGLTGMRALDGGRGSERERTVRFRTITSF
jgi:hypothetical protein